MIDIDRAEEDKALGRFYTPARVAQLALALALGPAGSAGWREARIWDPTCGDGGFLRQAAAMGAKRLVGHDVDRAAVVGLAAMLPEASLQHADLFDLDPAEVGLFEAIAGNPPYVRHERLDPVRKKAIARELGAWLGSSLPAGADLSMLALLQCLRFLAPGGRLAFVLPATWLDVARTAELRAALVGRFSLLAVVESRTDTWFDNAAVNTVIAVFENAPATRTVFAQVHRTRPELAPTILGGQNGDDVRCRTVTPASLARATRWSPFLRAPDVWFDVRSRFGDAFVRPAEVLKLAYGTKPGISGFFAPKDLSELDAIEASCLRPFLRSLKGVDGYVVRATEVRGRLFVAPRDVTALPGAAAWIARGEQGRTRSGLPWPEAPSVQSNKPWWRLPTPRTGALLFPQFRAARHYVIDNPDRVLVNNSAWWGAWIDPALHEVGIALINTSWMALAAEVLGRVNLGEGLLTLYGPEIAALPLPDPRRLGPPSSRAVREAWSSMRARPVLPFRLEVQQEDRRALDAAGRRGRGLDPALAPQIRDAAASLMAARLALAHSRRPSRRAATGP